MRFKSILIATDLSEHSVSLIRKITPAFYGAESVTLAACIDSRVFPREDVNPWPVFKDLKHSWISKAEASLESICKQISPKSTYELLVAQSSIAEEICSFAKKGNYDLLVIGSHGQGVLATLALGSTAQRIIQHAPCPVLILPNNIKNSERTFTLQNAHIIAATELAEDSFWFLDTLSSIVEEKDRLTLTTVLTQISFPIWPLGNEKPPASMAEYFEQRKPQAQKHLEQLSNMYLKEKSVHCEVLECPDNVAGILCEYAEKIKADCITIGSHGAGVLADLIIGSTVQNILRLSKCPVILFPISVAK